MRWIEIEKGIPALNSVVLAQYRSGDLEYRPYTGPEDWWRRNVMRWLDERPDIIIDDNLTEITQVMRTADRMFQDTGGSTRHYVRDVFIPLLNDNGYHFCKKVSYDSIQDTPINK